MEKKQQPRSFGGLSRDTSISKQQPQFLWDARNIRFDSKENSTKLSIINEKGTKDIETIWYNNGDWKRVDIKGHYLGHCVINDYIVLFTTGQGRTKNNPKLRKLDNIYRIKKELNIESKEYGKYKVELLFTGNLNFSKSNPIQTLGAYESDLIQKVYWIDGRNQLRVINIKQPELYGYSQEDLGLSYNGTFEVVPYVDLKETVKIQKKFDSLGYFPSGVIQYYITYYNKYGAETNIVYSSPLLYTSNPDRAGSPEESCNNIFEITVSNLDKKFDYLRVYSYIRTSLDAVGNAKIVYDYNIKSNKNTYTIDSITIRDDGKTGSDIDPVMLQYLGGDIIIPKTFEQKDGTLFLGNYSVDYENLNPYNASKIIETPTLSFELRNVYIPINKSIVAYQYGNSLTCYDSKDLDSLSNSSYFKFGEFYRLGYQLQDYTGKWTNPIYVDTIKVEEKPFAEFTDDYIKEFLPSIKMSINLTHKDIIDKYKRIRPLYVIPELKNRKILAQGVLNPTVYNLVNRLNNSPYCQSSWFTRPFPPKFISGGIQDVLNNYFITSGAYASWRDDVTLYDTTFRGELQAHPYSNLKVELEDLKYKSKKWLDDQDKNEHDYLIPSIEITESDVSAKTTFATDQKTNTFHSPDIVFNEDFINLNYNMYKLSVIGFTLWDKNIGNINLQTSSVVSSDNAKGFYKNDYTTLISGNGKVKNYIINEAGRNLISGLYYNDYIIDDKNSTTYEPVTNDDKYLHNFMVFPWEMSGSLNNDINRDGQTSILKTKTIANLKSSNIRDILTNSITLNSDIGIFSSDQVALFKYLKNKNYYGNIDTLYIFQANNSNEVATGYKPLVSIPSTMIDYTDVINAKTLYCKSQNTPKDVGWGNINVRSAENHGWLRYNVYDNTKVQWWTGEEKNIEYATNSPILDNGIIIRIKNSATQQYLQMSSTSKLMDFGYLASIEYKSNATEEKDLREQLFVAFPFSPSGGGYSLLIYSYYSLFNDPINNNYNRIGPDYKSIPDLSLEHPEYSNYVWGKAGLGFHTLGIVPKLASTGADNGFHFKSLLHYNLCKEDKYFKDFITGELTTDENEATIYNIEFYATVNPTGDEKYFIVETGNLYGQNSFVSNIDQSKLNALEAAVSTVINLKLNREIPQIIDDYSQPPANKVSNIFKAASPYLSFTQKYNVKKLTERGYYIKNPSYTADNFILLNSRYTFNNKIGDYNDSLVGKNSSIRMRYKSTPHLLVALNDGKYSSFQKIYEDKSSTNLNTYSSSLISELIVESDNPEDFYGNTDNYKLMEHTWIPCGESVEINTEDNTIVNYKYGDTWYQKFDCLKTYPFSNEDENKIVEIESFMCETHINIDGRYDINRGLENNININNVNFNQLNKVYSQLDNFFSYKIIPEDFYKINHFPNQILYTKTHVITEDIDAWTNMSAATVLDLDGDKGEITALTKYNNQLIAFQNKAINLIKFNERVQIPVTDGVPVELGNSGKVDGKEIIANNIGTNNKWSILSGSSSLYFINSFDGELYSLGGNNESSMPLNVSSYHGLSTWFNTLDNTEWTTNNYSNKLFYDFSKKDLYITTKEDCLNLNEEFGVFTSFFDYGNTQTMFNYGNEYLGVLNYTSNDKSEWVNMYELFRGDYNYFYNTYRPYYFTFVSNEDPVLGNKIFTNLDMRADWWSTDLIDTLSRDTYFKNGKADVDPDAVYDGESNYHNSDNFFDYIRIWNEYQDSGIVKLTNTYLPKYKDKDGKPLFDLKSLVKRKFRNWNIQLPRDKAHQLQRIRNNWAMITLGKNNDNIIKDKDLMELHDLTVTYYI